MKKRFLCIALAVAMVASLASCSNEPKTSSGDSEKSSSSSKSESKEQVDTAVTKVTWGFQGQTFSEEKWPTDIFKEFNVKMAEVAGVELEFQGWSDNQALELALASANLPDAVMVGRDYVPALLNGNHMIALDDYLPDAPNFTGLSETRIEAMKKYYSKDNDGKLYFWTPHVGTEQVGSAWWNGMTIRWDYYKELGYPEVKTEDDFLNVVKQAVDKHPTTEDGKKVYGVGTFSDGTLWGWWIRGAMFGFHNISDAYSFDTRDYDNQKIVSNYMDFESPVWRDIEYYYKANQMGIFDPDSFTMKGADLNAKATNGQLVATNCQWYGGDLAINSRAQDPESMAQFMVLPIEGQHNWGGASNAVGWSFFNGITKYAKEPEKIMKVFDYLSTAEGARQAFMGDQGDRWDVIDGKAQVTQKAIDIKAKGGVDWELYGSGIMQHIIGPSAGVVCADGAPANLWNVPELWIPSLTPAEKDFSDHYGVDVPAQVANNLIDEGKAYDKRNQNSDLISLIPACPQDITRIDSKCLDIMNKAIPKLVLAKDKTEFDAIKEETVKLWQSANVQKSIDWWTEQNAELDKFFDSIK